MNVIKLFLDNFSQVFSAAIKEIITREITAQKLEKIAWEAEYAAVKREREIACLNIIHELKKNVMIKESHIQQEIKNIRNRK